MPQDSNERNPEPISIAVARDEFGTMVSRVQFGGERIPITKNGKLAAYLVTVGDAEKLGLIVPEAAA